MISNITMIKTKIACLYKKKMKVHVDVSLKSKKKFLENVPGIVTAIYPNLFAMQLEEDGSEKNYTFQYVDLLTHNVDIKELNKLD